LALIYYNFRTYGIMWLKIAEKGDVNMCGAKYSLMKPLTGLFIGAMCIIYHQQIEGLVEKALGLFGDIIYLAKSLLLSL